MADAFAADRQSQFAFSTKFLRDHAGHIISDPKTAITELIANAYDAGATKVQITWPDDTTGQFVISDNGTGMTEAEFNRRWKTLSYDRLKEQGESVTFPPGSQKRNRSAFGQNGKGRHAAFCFSDSYVVTTKKAGQSLTVEVTLTEGGPTPFLCQTKERTVLRDGQTGTEICAALERGILSYDTVLDVIGTRFIVDPSFRVDLNGHVVELFDLRSLSTETLEVLPYGTVEISILDSSSADRSSKLKGIAWWVRDRLVGEPSWHGLDGEGNILDGRTAAAKRFAFIVKADLMRDDVKADWMSFHATERSNAIVRAVRSFVAKKIYESEAEDRKTRKKAALDESRAVLRELPEQSKQIVAQFVEQVQDNCPRLSEQDLAATVRIYATLEQTRSGYDLLKKLAQCSSDDLDGWNAIMQQWTASSATVVLNELGQRLLLLSKLQGLVNERHADEVHDLQPLFERGLWMFGPEYEAVDFRSNRGMAGIIRKFFGKENQAGSQKRPDFVALSNSSIGAYAANDYADNGEAFGYRKVLIVELKRGGFTITQDEVDQARNYIKEIRAAGCVNKNTFIEAYILGSTIESDLEPITMGTANVMKPLSYDNLLTRAHMRTFGLQKKIEDLRLVRPGDPELREVLDTPEPIPLFTH